MDWAGLGWAGLRVSRWKLGTLIKGTCVSGSGSEVRCDAMRCGTAVNIETRRERGGIIKYEVYRLQVTKYIHIHV